MRLTPYQSQYYAWLLSRRTASDSPDMLASTLVDAQVDLNPHQVDAALFAFHSPLSKGVILADEVGLGKTIEAGLVIAQRWAERKRRILVIVPANLRKQWHQELQDKFSLSALILEARSYNQLRKDGVRPFAPDDQIVVCSYQFAKAKADDLREVPWDLVVLDEAHRLRNVYKPGNVIGKALKESLAHARKVLLTATPLQNSLNELYGLVSVIDDRVFGDLGSFREQFGNRSDSPIRLKQVILDAPSSGDRLTSISVAPNIAAVLGISPETQTGPGPGSLALTAQQPAPIFISSQERQVAAVAMGVLAEYSVRPQEAPSREALLAPELQQKIAETVRARVTPAQAELPMGTAGQSVDVEAVVRRTTEVVVAHTIDIPRIVVVPKGEVRSGFRPFTLDLTGLHLQPKDRTLVGQELRTHDQFTLSARRAGTERRFEDYIVHSLVDFDDIDYAAHAELLYDLAGQVVAHLRGYLKDDDEIRNVVDLDRVLIARNIHAQMMAHFEESATEYTVEVRSGFTPLREPTFSAAEGEPVRDYRETVDEPSRIKQMLFGGFDRCLYPIQKFDSDTERKFAIALERGAMKWFKPAKGQFQIYYKLGGEHPEYVPDFVAETDSLRLMCETKKSREMDSTEVRAKAEAGATWCSHATVAGSTKSWKYLLIPHEQVTADKRVSDYLRFEIRS